MSPDPSAPGWDWSRLRALCLREARAILGAGPGAEDAAQEAAIRAWRGSDRCRSPQAPEPWVRAIARREALRVLARRVELPLDAAPEGVEDPDPGLALDVWRELRRLNDQDVRLLVGRYWQDLSVSELAEQLGVMEVTVRVRLHRLRLRLRKTMVEA